MKIVKFLNLHKKSIIVKMIFVVIVYSILLTNNCVNCLDGIWEHPTFLAGNWELSLGRWALRYVDFARYGITMNPWTSIISLFIFVFGIEVFVEVFEVDLRSKWNYVVSFLFLGNMIVCNVLSYSYTSTGFSLAFMFSIISVWFIKRAHSCGNGGKAEYLWYVVGSAFSIALMMGLYQSYLGCTCVVIIFYIIWLMLKKENVKKIIHFIMLSILSGIFGFVVYEIIEKIELARWNASLSSYGGADSVSISEIIDNIGGTIRCSYSNFFQLVIGTNIKWNYFKNRPIQALLLALCVVSLLIVIVKLKENKKYIVIAVGLICILPPIANIAGLLSSTTGISERLTAPYAIILPCLLAVLGPISLSSDKFKTFYSKVVNEVFFLLSLFLLWGSVYQVLVDQETMREQLLVTTEMASQSVELLFNNSEYEPERPVTIVGYPADSDLYYDTGISMSANVYCKIAETITLDEWKGLISNRLGYNLNYCDGDVYYELWKSDAVKAMPSYPAYGCIKEIDGVVVVKLSDVIKE